MAFAEELHEVCTADAVAALGDSGGGEVHGGDGSALDEVDPVLPGVTKVPGQKCDRKDLASAWETKLEVELWLCGIDAVVSAAGHVGKS